MPRIDRWMAILAPLLTLAQQPPAAKPKVFPYLPESTWRLHDETRPLPPRVEPGTNGSAPSDAIVLFDGSSLREWVAVQRDGRVTEPAWKVENGYVEVVPGSGSLVSKRKFGAAQYHLEWATPVEIRGQSQGRGNSGFYLMNRYEVQILDSWHNPTYADGWAGAIYNHQPPQVDAARRPGEWQTFDILFEPPAFDGDRLVRPPYVTVLYNGVAIHHHLKITGRYNRDGTYEVHGPEEPVRLQNHSGDRVRFRNIWVRPLPGYDSGPKTAPPAGAPPAASAPPQ